jgi:hypothetical protein
MLVPINNANYQMGVGVANKKYFLMELTQNEYI